MLTNSRDAIRGQSRSPIIVPFHMLGIVSYQYEIVTLSLRRAVFPILDFKNAVTLKTGLGVLKVVGNITIRQSAYDFLFTFYGNYGSISCCY